MENLSSAAAQGEQAFDPHHANGYNFTGAGPNVQTLEDAARHTPPAMIQQCSLSVNQVIILSCHTWFPSASMELDSVPAPRPVIDRARDYALLTGAAGSIIGACVAARHDAPMLSSVITVGGGGAALAAGFIGLRHALLQDQWEKDNEAVSGLSAAALGATTATFLAGPRAGTNAAFVCFVGGGVLHYAHRWWLHVRLRDGW